STGDVAVAGGEVQVKYVPNYSKNITLFYWFIGVTIVLLLAIAMMANSISSLIKSAYFKERIVKRHEERNAGGSSSALTVLLIIGFLFAGNELFGMTFNRPGMAKEGEPWLLVENRDLYWFLAIDLVLLGVVFYLRWLFMNFMKMVRKPKVKQVEVSVTKKLNKVLTDAVAIEEEHKILMDHEYDGIQELDNNLPPWWVWGFYATIVFAVVYLFHYHVLGTGDLQIKAYEKEMVAKQKEVEEYLTKMAMNVDETTAELLEDPSELNQGKVIFEVNCATCHLEDGSGKIGPNLTDKTWIYGYDIKELFGVIKYGTSNGMPEHASKLKPTQIQQVASYVLHFQEAKNGKEPEGKIVEP
ncbi:MAG TPA: cbb3-type cytochrome c oxidase N-terminal domain-containing protein, partial [Taishania sp.]|nr:cbb3-type cytochrome c oxidase N-terminal domain-containing protein [Taishania sp.]